MGSNNSADQRRRAELAAQIVAIIPHLYSLEKELYQAIECMGVPANTTRAKIMRIYRLLKIVKMGEQDIDPRFPLAYVVIAVALGSVKCGLLMYVLLDDLPWPIVVLCILMAFAFIAN